MIGAGELIMRTALARRLSGELYNSPPEDAHDVIHRVFIEEFYSESTTWLTISQLIVLPDV